GINVISGINSTSDIKVTSGISATNATNRAKTDQQKIEKENDFHMKEHEFSKLPSLVQSETGPNVN
ncbi:43539_t:CDS:2, partial [Gigaspora margarita]